MSTSESQLEDHFIGKLRDLKYTHRPDIRDRAALEDNFRKKFNLLNRVTLTDGEFARLLDGIVTADVFTAARTQQLEVIKTHKKGLCSSFSHPRRHNEGWIFNNLDLP